MRSDLFAKSYQSLSLNLQPGGCTPSSSSALSGRSQDCTPLGDAAGTRLPRFPTPPLLPSKNKMHPTFC